MIRPLILCLALVLSALPAPTLADLPRPLDDQHTIRLVLEMMQKQAPHLVKRNANRWTGIGKAKGELRKREIAPLTASLREAENGAAREQLVQDFVSQLVQDARKAAEASEIHQAPKPPQPELIVPRIMRKRDLAKSKNKRQTEIWRAEGVSSSLTEQLQIDWGIMELTSPDKPKKLSFSPYCLKKPDTDLCDRKETISAGLANLPSMNAGLSPELLEGGRIHMVRGPGAWSLMLQNGFWKDQAGLDPAHMPEIVAAIPRRDLLFWIVDPVRGEVRELRLLAEAVNFSGHLNAPAMLEKYKIDFWTRDNDPLTNLPLQSRPVFIATPLSTVLFIRTGPQLWYDSGWALLGQ